MARDYESTKKIRESFAENNRVSFKQVTTRLGYAQIQVEIDGELIMFWDPEQPQVVQDIVDQINAVLALPIQQLFRNTPTHIIAKYFSDTPRVTFTYGPVEDSAYVDSVYVVSWPKDTTPSNRTEIWSSPHMSTRRLIDTIKRALYPERYVLSAEELAAEQAEAEELLNTAVPDEYDDGADPQADDVEGPPEKMPVLLFVSNLVCVVALVVTTLQLVEERRRFAGSAGARTKVLQLTADGLRRESDLAECEFKATTLEAEAEEAKRYWRDSVLTPALDAGVICLDRANQHRLLYTLKACQIKSDAFDEIGRKLRKAQ